MTFEEEKKLKEYIEIARTEVGEVMSAMFDVLANSDYISKELKQKLEEELLNQLAWFEENTKIVSEEIVQKHTVKRIDYFP